MKHKFEVIPKEEVLNNRCNAYEFINFDKDMKQTAVEWLFLMLNNPNHDQDFVNKLLKKAKEIEKQQQGYSEEEVIELLQKALTHQDDGEIGSLVTAQGEIRPANFFSWFNKFKNK